MRQKNGMMVGIFSLVIAVIIVMGVMAPMVSDWTTGERIENEGAGWLRMEYVSSVPTQTYIRANIGDEGLTVERETVNLDITETQTGEDDTIIYASSNLAVWMADGLLHILGQKEDGTVFYVQPSSLMIDLPFGWSAQRINYDENEDAILIPAPSWAYIPKSNGNYAFFNAGDAVKMESNKPLAVIGGGFADVYAYNNISRFGLPLQMQATYDDDGKLDGASWQKASAALTQLEPFDPSSITITPLDPSVIEPITLDPGSSASLMSVPTPTYTDGDWGYDLITVGDETKAAIVSYSGSGGSSLTVPATVGGYDVYQLGKGGDNQVFNASLVVGDLIISEGIESVATYSMRNLTYFTGNLVLPSTLKTIGTAAFQNCGFTGNLVLPNGITDIGNSAFDKCTGFTGTLVIPESITVLKTSFTECTGLTGVELPSNLTTLVGFRRCTFTSIEIPSSVTTIGNNAFQQSGLTSIEIPSSVTTIGASAFADCSHLVGTVAIPASVTTIGNYILSNSAIDKLVIASDATPGSNPFNSSTITEVLDLSDTVDYSVNRYGIPAGATVSDDIGDAFGYISFVEIGSDPKLTGPIATLLTTIPLLMVVGLTIAAMTMMRGRVQ